MLCLYTHTSTKASLVLSYTLESYCLYYFIFINWDDSLKIMNILLGMDFSLK